MKQPHPFSKLGMPGPRPAYTPPVTFEEFKQAVEESIGRKVKTVVANTSWDAWRQRQDPKKESTN